jgi:RecB family exonuclease
VPTQCVSVDASDALYLCGRGFLPTHNTGSAPRAGFEARSLFQLRLYALAIWRSRGVVPTRLQLVYLGEADSQVVAYDPDEDDLLATERKVDAIWAAIRESTRTGEFEPSPGKQCDWCPHHALCPVYGGTIPPLPAPPSRLDELRGTLRRRWRRLKRRVRQRVRQRTRADT